MNIVELLKLGGLDTSKNKSIKLIRHQNKDDDMNELMITGQFEIFQAIHEKKILECNYVVSFVGLPQNKARFYGVYKILGRKLLSEVKLPKNYKRKEKPEYNFYELQKESGFNDFFDDLEQRVVIDWGKPARAYNQWLKEKEVIEILPAGYTRPFLGYLDVNLNYYELKRIFDYKEANREWQIALSNVAGVYLILQPSTGGLYVGSAYGKNGIWGRWQNYVDNGHGGNKLLKQICDKKPNSHHEFRFSILRTLDKSLTQKEVINYENFYKDKLGTRAFGLNEN